MDTTQWPQGIGVPKPMEISNSGPMIERKPRPQKEQALNCPRCNSTNTKFCYYNNYSLTQPRYFCKTCRRYWTEGGSLRNVPVGGGSRKNKRSSSTSSPSSSSSSKKVVVPHDLTPPPSFSQNPKIHQGQDLNLAYPPTSDYSNISNFVHLPYNDTKSHHQNPNSSSNSRGLSSFMPMPVTDTNTIYPSGFAMQEFKPTLNFTLDGFESGYGGLQGVQETSARLFFPFEDLKNVSNTCDLEENRGQGESNGCWNGMLGGGSW